MCPALELFNIIIGAVESVSPKFLHGHAEWNVRYFLRIKIMSHTHVYTSHKFAMFLPTHCMSGHGYAHINVTTYTLFAQNGNIIIIGSFLALYGSAMHVATL